MTDEANTTPLEGVTDNVELSDDDTSEEFDYYDPDEDQDTEVSEESEETEDEADEVKAEDEAQDQEAEDQAEEDADPDTVTVTLSGGEQVPLGELKKGYLRQDDYSRKTQDLSNQRSEVDANVQRMEAITTNLVEQLTKLVPAAPDPALAMTDPDAYNRQDAQHRAGMAQMQNFLTVEADVKEVSGGMSEADQRTAAREANQRLIERFPEAASGKSREQFFEGVGTAAMNLGFKADELSNITDDRIFAMAHYAKIGMKHLENKAVAKAKVAKAPPAAPRKPGQGAGKQSGNAEAMRKLSRSGSLRDALAVDFD